MCGSLSGYRSWKEMRDWYALIPSEELKAADLKPTAVIRPTDLQPFIRLSGPDRILDIGGVGVSTAQAQDYALDQRPLGNHGGAADLPRCLFASPLCGAGDGLLRMEARG